MPARERVTRERDPSFAPLNHGKWSVSLLLAQCLRGIPTHTLVLRSHEGEATLTGTHLRTLEVKRNWQCQAFPIFSVHNWEALKGLGRGWRKGKASKFVTYYYAMLSVALNGERSEWNISFVWCLHARNHERSNWSSVNSWIRSYSNVALRQASMRCVNRVCYSVYLESISKESPSRWCATLW